MGSTQSALPDVQSVLVGDATTDASAVYRSPIHSDKTVWEIGWEPGETLWSRFVATADAYPDTNCFGERVSPSAPFTWTTYKTVEQTCEHLAAGLAYIGLAKGDVLAVYDSFNSSAAWATTELACLRQGFVPVGLYSSFTPSNAAERIRLCRATALACSLQNYAALIDLNESLGHLKHVILFDANDDLDVETTTTTGSSSPSSSSSSSSSLATTDTKQTLSIFTLQELVNLGAESPCDADPADEDTTALLCLTSGSSSRIRFVKLSNRNLCSLLGAMQLHAALQPGDVHLSYLPMAHVLERAIIHQMLHQGGSIGFMASNDLTKLVDAAQQLQPTFFPGVPRVFDRIRAKVWSAVQAAGGMKKWMFELAYDSKVQALRDNNEVEHALWDATVFKSTRDILGGRVRLILTGSAPMSQATSEFVQVAFSSPMIQGYGLTELSGAVATSRVDDHSSGHCGPPLPCMEIKIVDVDYLGYTHMDDKGPSGLIHVRGPNVCLGYLNHQDHFDDALDREGWFNTEDIGRFNPNGTLSIIDRLNNIHKNAQGDCMALHVITDIVSQCPYIEFAYVHGDSAYNSLVAIVVPSEEAEKWALANGLTPPDDNDEKVGAGLPAHAWICNEPKVQRFMSMQVRLQGEKANLQPFEIPAAIFLWPHPFSIEEGHLTAAFKQKRRAIGEYFQKEIAALLETIE